MHNKEQRKTLTNQKRESVRLLTDATANVLPNPGLEPVRKSHTGPDRPVNRSVEKTAILAKYRQKTGDTGEIPAGIEKFCTGEIPAGIEKFCTGEIPVTCL
jgi:hypothetical protein